MAGMLAMTDQACQPGAVVIMVNVRNRWSAMGSYCGKELLQTVPDSQSVLHPFT